MPKTHFLKRQLANFLAILLVVSYFFSIQDSYAIYDDVRGGVTYHPSNNTCQMSGIEFDPFGSNKDTNWEVTNAICATFITIQGAAMIAAGAVTDVACVATNMIGVNLITAEKGRGQMIPELPYIYPGTLHKIAHRASLFTSRLSEAISLRSAMIATCADPFTAALCPAAEVQAELAAADAIKCGSAYSSYLIAVAAGVAVLGVIYASAKGTYDNARVCGHDWNSWGKVNQEGDIIDPGSDVYSNPSAWITRIGKYQGSYEKCLEDLFANNSNSCGLGSVDGVPANEISLRNKYYREYLYGGKEYEDSACKVPSSWDSDKRAKRLGYTDDNQRYYMQGPGVAGNYACRRFMLSGSVDSASAASYDCCKRRSQNTICIENAPLDGFQTSAVGFKSAFCEFGERCNVAGIWFEVYPSKEKVNYICAKTYSVCPYNHLLGGGTEKQKFTNDAEGFPTGNNENFCQYLKHCVKIPVLPYVRISDLQGAFIAGACRDFKGSTQNVYGFDGDIIPVNTRGFSAPIVECFKETMQNLMMNRAGSTKCSNPDESAVNGICDSGNYAYKEGDIINQVSFFKKLQENLRSIIKMVLTLSITFFGFGVLLGMEAINKKKMLLYIMKLGLVMYFALGDAWQTQFVAGVMKSSDYISDIMVKIDDNVPANKLDGCQFPKFNYADNNEQSRYDNPRYPYGKEYLKIWDMLDCKLARSFGYGPEASVPNLIKMILAGFFTGGLGIVFLVAVFIYAFFFLSLILRAIHIFLMATIAITILIYVSPVTITLCLFERTKGIFTNWWKQLLGFILNPVILFAYLGIYISLFDATMIGDVTFRGDGRQAPKAIVCDDKTEDTSIYCIFKVANLKTYSGLEIIGIGIPILTSMNQAKLQSIMKAAFIMFIFSNFMDKIADLAKALVGGDLPRSKTASTMEIAGAAAGALKGIQKRGTRLAKRVGGAALSKVGNTARNVANIVGNRGKRITKSKGPGGSQGVGSSSGGSGVGNAGAGGSGVGSGGAGSSGAGGSTGYDKVPSLRELKKRGEARAKADKDKDKD